MDFTSEQIEKSIRLAEAIATKENQIRVFKKHRLTANFVEERRTRVGGHYEELLKDPLAEKLLPQARIIVRMRDARLGAINQTLLGTLILALINEQCPEEGEHNFFADNPHEEVWEKFRSAFAIGDKVGAFDALVELLIEAKFDVMETKLPPIPPEYRLPK